MMRSVRQLVSALMMIGALTSSLATTLNEGTRTNNLGKLEPVDPFLPIGSVTTTIRTNTSPYLTASQEGASFDPVITAWYARNATVTNPVYTVSAEFRPAANETFFRGGVMGWIDATKASRAISLRLVPPAKVQVSSVDFNNSLNSDSSENLFSLNGAPATATSSSATVTADYRPDDFAIYEIAFTEPTTNDLEVLPQATTHLIAQVKQVSADGTQTNIVAGPIELLSDLPVPGASVHRVSYQSWLARFNYTSAPPEDIGDLRNLAVEGEIEINEPPEITLTNPEDGMEFTEGVPIPLAAMVSDADGSIARVEFFAGADLLASVDTAPYEYLWTEAGLGEQVLTATATDDRGVVSGSAPVTVTVVPPNQPPTVSITSPLDGADYVAPATIVLIAAAQDSDGAVVGVEFFDGTVSLGEGTLTGEGYELTWANVEAGSYQVVARATDDDGESTDSSSVGITVTRVVTEQPVMTATVLANGNLQVTWTSTGFQLQYKVDLNDAEWIDIPGTLGVTSADVPKALQAQYLRLVGEGTAPTGLRLTISSEGNEIVISWPAAATGYALRVTDSLGALDPSWQILATPGNTYREAMGSTPRFFELVK